VPPGARGPRTAPDGATSGTPLCTLPAVTHALVDVPPDPLGPAASESNTPLWRQRMS
jgi:hypothetical protein